MSGHESSSVVVLDCGTTYSKLGHSGNQRPTFIVPTAVAEEGTAAAGTGNAGRDGPLSDLAYLVGEEAVRRSGAAGWRVGYPVRDGVVQDWPRMEKLWHRFFYDYLRTEPEGCGVVLAESPAAAPAARETAAEIMFETFAVARLHIAPPGTLALRASAADGGDAPAYTGTGVVVDIGEGATHIIPVVDGCVVRDAVRTLPAAGSAITDYVLECLRDRRDSVLPAVAPRAAAQRLKEQSCYVCADPVEELARFDKGECHRPTHSTTPQLTGVEQFLAPEVLFHPGMLGGGDDGAVSLPEAVDDAIWACPIDYRRPLYSNIVLSGGTVALPGLGDRLRREVAEVAARRARRAAARQEAYNVQVAAHSCQQFADWRGGSALGASGQFKHVAFTRQQYEEEGPRIFRDHPSAALRALGGF